MATGRGFRSWLQVRSGVEIGFGVCIMNTARVTVRLKHTDMDRLTSVKYLSYSCRKEI